ADGKTCPLASLPTGVKVNLGLAVDQATACSIGAEGPHLGGCGGSEVKAIDPEKRTLTFADRTMAEVAGKTFTVGKDANITIDGRPGRLAEVPVGAQVSARLRVDQQTVGTIHATGAVVSGVVKAMDVGNRTITVDDTTYDVARGVLVVIDGKERPLTELAVGVS